MLRPIKNASAVVWAIVLVSTIPALTSDYVSSLDRFCGQFYTMAIAQPDTINRNAVMSPLSGHIAMTILSMGTTGETTREILKALNLRSVEEAALSIKQIMQNSKKVVGVDLDIANQIFASADSDRTLDPEVPSYEYKIKKILKIKVKPVDFSRSAEAARTINEWVSSKTNNSINNIVDENSISDQTSAILVNTIYLKGHWSKKFNPKWTRTMNFTTLDGSKVQVDMMHQDQQLLVDYSTELKSKIVVLPYEQNDVSMVVILPDAIDGIKALEKKLKNGVNKYLVNLTEDKVTFGLPKMLIETTIDVKDAFSKLGVRRVFSDDSKTDFTIEGEPKIFVSQAVQKAFLEVNEEGAVAAAATGIGVIQLSAVPEIICDHPFVFMIRTKDVVLFMGSFYGQ